MSTWLSRCYIRLWFCVRFAVLELLSSSCNKLLLFFSSERSVTKINTVFIAINECGSQPFLGWPQASIICLRPICKYWFVLHIICSHFIWNLEVLQFCSLYSVWYQRYNYTSKDLPIHTIDSQGCQVMKMRWFFKLLKKDRSQKAPIEWKHCFGVTADSVYSKWGKKWNLHMQMYGIWKCHIATSTYK